MDITSGSLQALYRGFKTAFQTGFAGVTPQWSKIATLVPSTTSQEDYGWLGDVAAMREWVGDRTINAIKMHAYAIKNKAWELTQGVDRHKIADDQYGIYNPLFQMMGDSAGKHPDELIFALLAAGFGTPCYDGQYYFDTDHPVMQPDGKVASVSNMQSGPGNPWFLLDTTRPLKPLIYQQRQKPEFTALDKPDQEHVFMRKEYLYGIECRDNAGYGFWQMGFGSKAALTAENFEAAQAAMGALKKDNGQPLGITPNLLVCGPTNQAAAKKLVEAQLIKGGESNINYKAVDLLVTPYLA